MRLKILVVDDEPQFERLMRQRFRKRLRNEEFEFIFAENGQHALQQLEKHPDIDLILSDINMPVMDGLEFLQNLHQQGLYQKTIIVSAYGDLKNIRAAMNMGAYDFVTKPINFEDLEQTIQKAIREIQWVREAEQQKEQLLFLQKELSIAQNIQQSIIPTNFEAFSDGHPFSLYGSMTPAKEVGGDFYDFFWLRDSRLVLTMADVSGKGMPAALFMAVSRTLLRAIGHQVDSPEACLEKVNQLLWQENETGMFVTVFYAILDLEQQQLTYCSAGHNPPYLLHANGQLQCLEDAQHLALGITEEVSYAFRQIPFKVGNLLLLFTDGLTEAVSSGEDMFGESQLEAFLSQQAGTPPQQLVQQIIAEVHKFRGDQSASDDLSMLAIRMEQ